MFRNGQFQDIEWDNFAEKHKKHWRIISEKYGITLARADSQMDGKAPKSLDFLAQQCVQLCSSYLWGMEGYTRKLDSRLRSDMQNYLEATLCDHLIVTFAYRFYCENLASESREQYWKKVQDNDKGYEKSVSSFHAKYRDYEADIEEIVGTYQAMMQTDLDAARKKIGSSRSNLKSANDLQSHHRNAHISAQLAANMRDAHQAELEELKKRGQAVKKAKNLLDSARFKNENLSVLNWIFAFAMASDWSRSPFRVKNSQFAILGERPPESGTNLLERLTDFLGHSEWRNFLMGIQEKSIPYVTYTPTDSKRAQLFEQTTSIMGLRLISDSSNDSAYSENWKRVWSTPIPPFPYQSSILCPPIDPAIFVGIVCDSGEIGSPKLTKQHYMLKSALVKKNSERKHTGKTDAQKKQEQKKKEKNSIVVPPEIQYVFNSYLLERNLHGYAITIALTCIAAHNKAKLSNEQLDQYIKAIRVTRLHAPLVHSSLILLIAQEIQEERGVYWVESYIDYMNTVALPVLEELFLREVYRAYAADTIQDVFRKIEESFGKSEIEEVPAADTAPSTGAAVNTHGIPEINSKLREIIHQQEQQALRCNRLAYYRLIPKGKNHCTTYDKNCERIINQIVVEGYAAAMGSSPSVAGESAVQIDLCTAFDD